MILACIIVMAFLAHVIAGGESLSDYAEKHPEAAYGTAVFEDETQPDPCGETALPEETTVPGTSGEEGSGRDNTDAGVQGQNPVFYAEELTPGIIDWITGFSFPEEGSVHIDYADLRYLHLTYVDAEGETHIGEMICNEAIAQDLLLIFQGLYEAGYPIECMRLLEDFDGDDVRSMTYNNTSCFNFRTVGNSSVLSNHALGMAVDINPLYNPEVVYDSDGNVLTVSPKEGEASLNREGDGPYMIHKGDEAYRLFTEHGFTWGGDWNTKKDYQHFEKAID